MISDLRKNYNKWYSDNLKNKSSDLPKPTSQFYDDLLLSLISLNKKGKKLLDVACGIGYFMVRANEMGLKTTGVDISDKAVKYAKKMTGSPVFRSKAEKLPFKNNTFDFVTCIGSLEHFEDPEKSLHEMSRVLKKDGVSLIHVPNMMFIGHIYMSLRYGIMPTEGEQEFSENYRTYKAWEKLITDNGFDIVKVTSYNDMHEARRVNMVTKFIWQSVICYFVPFYLSYSFNFYCRKKN